MSTETVRPEWAARRERSNLLALRFMAWLALTAGRPLTRLLLHPITLYYLCCAPAARRNSARYLRRVLGREPRWSERYRHLHAFAAVVLDRVYFVSSRTDLFDLSLSGSENVDAVLAKGRGGVLLGAHLGSFEALHAVAETRPSLRVAMAMYPDNAQMIHNVLQAVAPSFELGIIAIGRRGSTLAIRDWVDAGGMVGLLGDRYLGASGARPEGSLLLPFLGQPTRFSDGPLRLALLLRRPVIFMVGLYFGGKRYELRFEPLVDFSDPPTDPAAREACIHDAMRAYVARLEALAREAPYNWFNFYDYWGEDRAA